MSNPWKKVSAPTEVLSLSDIMSEEYAKSIRLKDEQNSLEHRVSIHTSPEDLKQARSTSDCDDATVKMSQCDLDEEHEDDIKRAQNKLDRDAKLAVAYYCNMHQLSTTSTDDSDSEKSVETISNDWEYFETDEEFTCLPKQTHVPKDNRLAIKHDIINSRRIAMNLLDDPTRRILSKYIIDGIIRDINGVVSVGKRAIVLHAHRVRYDGVVEERAIKVFRTSRDRTMPRNKNIKDDLGLQNSQELAIKRAERESYLCGYAYQIGNVASMPFKGKHQKPCPNLKDVTLTPDEWQKAYKCLTNSVKRFYQVRLIHGHLIKNNVLWNNVCHVLSFGRSVSADHPRAFHFLLRDCHNICKFFKKKGVQDVKKTEELFEWITGFEANICNSGRM